MVGRAATAGGAALISQGVAAGGAAGFAASVTDVAGTRAGYAAQGISYEGSLRGDVSQIASSTLFGGIVGGAGGAVAQAQFNGANAQVKGAWGETFYENTTSDQILGGQVTVDTANARVRPDYYVSSPEGGGARQFVDIKTGPTAGLNGNQTVGYSELSSQGGVPRGANAAAADLTSGQAIGPTPVNVVSYKGGVYPGGSSPSAVPTVVRPDDETK